MITKSVPLRPIPSFLLPFTHPAVRQSRCLHQNVKAKPIPAPTPFVPNKETFLSLIGRGLSQHASKIPSWNALFSLTSTQLKDLGVDPPRNRRYLLWWREKFRTKQFGIGGNFKHVKNGVAELRVAEVPAPSNTIATATLSPGMRKIVVDVAEQGSAAKRIAGKGKSAVKGVPAKGVKIKGADTIVGPHVQPIKGGKGARIVVKEGLWEVRRGHKIDGGERRQAEVRAKRRSEEKRTR